MFGEEVKKLLLEVISSWQVLAVTGVLIIYASIVNYAARTHHRSRRSRKPPKIKAKELIPDALASSENDELGFEEETRGK